MAFKFNEYHLGGSGGGSAVLTELTVTENGVYDKPVISNAPEPITWDGNTDGKTFVSVENTLFVKMSDRVFSIDDFADYAVTMSDGYVFNTKNQVYDAPGAVIIGEMCVISVSDTNALYEASGTFNLPESGTYFAYNTANGMHTVSLTFAGGTPTPADGWNKVTVNVAGDIVDVSELPTEVDEGKIYRVTKEAETAVYTAFIANNGSPMVMTFADMFEAEIGEKINVTTQVVESLPDAMEPIDYGTPMTVPCYVLESTGVPYVSTDGTSASAAPLSAMLEVFVDKGWVNSVEDMVVGDVSAVYTLRGSSSTTYGIPNAHPVKRLVDGAWVDLT